MRGLPNCLYKNDLSLSFRGKARLALSLLALLIIFFNQLPSLSNNNATTLKESQDTYKQVRSSPADLLIVQLTDNADREEFDQLLYEIHGTVLRTLIVSPTLKFLIVQTEPGKAQQVQKRLSKSKDVAHVDLNQAYRVDHAPRPAPSGHHSTLPPSGHHSTLPPSGHHHTAPPLPAPPQPPPTPPQNQPPLSGTPNDPLFASEWDLTMMAYTQARDSGSPTTTPVSFYFLDTGVKPYNNSEFPSQITQLDFSNPNNPTGYQENLYDSGFHGTTTASVLATSDNDTAFAGVANFEGNRCSLTMCRISQDGQSSDLYRILSALAFIAQHSNLTPGPINISFGSAPPYTLNGNASMQAVARALYNMGFQVVVASGNDGAYDGSAYTPYIEPVDAVGQDGLLASFSNYGTFRAAAPGVSVPVDSPSGPGYGSGTSYAAPRWVAAIGAVMGVLPAGNRTAVYANQIVKSSATITNQGLTIPNLYAAMQMAAGPQ